MARARILLAVLLFAAVLVRAEPVSQLRPSNYVNDFAHVLSAQTVAELNDICRQLDEKAHAQVAVVTVNSLDGSDIDSYAVDLFKGWGIGSKSTNRGVLILLATKDHKYRTEVGYGLEGAIPDAIAKRITAEEIKPRFQRGDYDGGIIAGAHALMKAARGEYKNAGRDGISGGHRQPWPIYIFVAIFFLIAVSSFRRSRRIGSRRIRHSG